MLPLMYSNRNLRRAAQFCSMTSRPPRPPNPVSYLHPQLSFIPSSSSSLPCLDRGKHSLLRLRSRACSNPYFANLGCCPSGPNRDSIEDSTGMRSEHLIGLSLSSPPCPPRKKLCSDFASILLPTNPLSRPPTARGSLLSDMAHLGFFLVIEER